MRPPDALPSDPPGVAEALELAQTAWDLDRADSIVWVRRAAHLAERLGKDERAVELALAAANLVEHLMTSTTLPVARKFDERATTQDVDVKAFREAAKKSK